MAGTHNSGFKYSKAALFKGAAMILYLLPATISRLLTGSKTLAPVGFGRLTITTAEKMTK